MTSPDALGVLRASVLAPATLHSVLLTGEPGFECLIGAEALRTLYQTQQIIRWWASLN